MNNGTKKENTNDETDLLPGEKGKYHKHHGDDARFWGNRGAGILIIANDTRRLLLVLRSQYVNEPGTWGMPGGKIDDDDTDPRAAAMREVREELGYSGAINIVPAHVFKAGKFKFFNFIGAVDSEFVPTLDWENENFGWFSLDELPSPLHFGVQSLLNNSGDKIKKMIKEYDTRKSYLKEMISNLVSEIVREHFKEK